MRRIHVRVTLFFALFLLSNVAGAQRLDDYIRTVMHEHQIVGLSVAVVRDGKILEAKGYGLANLETGTPATAQTVYKIASISKQFIATGIMLLVGEGKVSLDAPIKKYVDDAPEAWSTITVEQCANACGHRRGSVTGRRIPMALVGLWKH